MVVKVAHQLRGAARFWTRPLGSTFQDAPAQMQSFHCSFLLQSKCPRHFSQPWNLFIYLVLLFSFPVRWPWVPFQLCVSRMPGFLPNKQVPEGAKLVPVIWRGAMGQNWEAQNEIEQRVMHCGSIHNVLLGMMGTRLTIWVMSGLVLHYRINSLLLRGRGEMLHFIQKDSSIKIFHDSYINTHICRISYYGDALCSLNELYWCIQ